MLGVQQNYSSWETPAWEATKSADSFVLALMEVGWPSSGLLRVSMEECGCTAGKMARSSKAYNTHSNSVQQQVASV